jgi:hypothetical protein
MEKMEVFISISEVGQLGRFWIQRYRFLMTAETESVVRNVKWLIKGRRVVVPQYPEIV